MMEFSVYIKTTFLHLHYVLSKIQRTVILNLTSGFFFWTSRDGINEGSLQTVPREICLRRWHISAEKSCPAKTFNTLGRTYRSYSLKCRIKFSERYSVVFVCKDSLWSWEPQEKTTRWETGFICGERFPTLQRCWKFSCIMQIRNIGCLNE